MALFYFYFIFLLILLLIKNGWKTMKTKIKKLIAEYSGIYIYRRQRAGSANKEQAVQNVTDDGR